MAFFSLNNWYNFVQGFEAQFVWKLLYNIATVQCSTQIFSYFSETAIKIFNYVSAKNFFTSVLQTFPHMSSFTKLERDW